MSAGRLSNREILRRMLALAAKYRWGCVRLVAVQLAALALGVIALNFGGTAIDTIVQSVRGQDPPGWPLGIASPQFGSGLQATAALAGVILVLAILRAV